MSGSVLGVVEGISGSLSVSLTDAEIVNVAGVWGSQCEPVTQNGWISSKRAVSISVFSVSSRSA